MLWVIFDIPDTSTIITKSSLKLAFRLRVSFAIFGSFIRTDVGEGTSITGILLDEQN
jgi:hypothetical protein